MNISVHWVGIERHRWFCKYAAVAVASGILVAGTGSFGVAQTDAYRLCHPNEKQCGEHIILTPPPLTPPLVSVPAAKAASEKVALPPPPPLPPPPVSVPAAKATSEKVALPPPPPPVNVPVAKATSKKVALPPPPMPAPSATMEKRSVPPPPKRLPAARSAKPARELVAGVSEIKLERLLQISFKPRDVELSTAARSKLDGLAEHVATVGGEIQIKHG